MDVDEDALAIAARTDPKARALIVERFDGLIGTIAADFETRRTPGRVASAADKRQAGALGLLRAIDTWKPELGTFAQRAAQCIRNAILAECGITRGGKRLRPIPPGLEDVSPGFDPAPHDEGDSPDFDHDTIADFGRPAHERTAEASARRKLAALVAAGGLTERELAVIEGRAAGLTQTEVAAETGVRQQSVAETEQRAITKLRAGVLKRGPKHTPPNQAPRTKGRT